MYSILIIEDEQRVADLLRAGLEENGYDLSGSLRWSYGAENVPGKYVRPCHFGHCAPQDGRI